MRAKRLLLDELFDTHMFEVPAKMVDQEFETIWNQYKEQQAEDTDPKASQGRRKTRKRKKKNSER